MIRLTLILVLVINFSTFASNVKILGAQSTEDISHIYIIKLLQLALDKSKHLHGQQSLHILANAEITQGRSIRLLNDNFVDVHWAGSNIEREKYLLPIRFPLFKGLLGYRVSIIYKDNLTLFQKLTPKKLKKLIACQGAHWPDSDILEFNQYKVMRVPRFDLMFKMVNQKRCDYFPRAIFEGYAELKAAQEQYPNLIMFDEVILHYNFPMYFFVNKQNPKLAEQIHYGLQQALNDGSIKEMFRKDITMEYLFPLNKWQSKQFYNLKNPYLPELTPINDPLLWSTLEK